MNSENHRGRAADGEKTESNWESDLKALTVLKEADVGWALFPIPSLKVYTPPTKYEIAFIITTINQIQTRKIVLLCYLILTGWVLLP